MLVGDCQKCQFRQNMYDYKPQPAYRYVYHESAKVALLVGDYPTNDDMMLEKPISGILEDLMHKILIESGDNLTVYYTNTIKCCTHRSPKKEHLQLCKIWLWKDIQEVKPDYIFTLGTLSTKLLLKKDRLKGVVGKPHMTKFTDEIRPIIIPCYSLKYILEHNRKVYNQCVQVFSVV